MTVQQNFRPHLTATLHFLPTNCGGRKAYVFSGYRPTIGFVGSSELNGISLEFPNDECVWQNETVEAKIYPLLLDSLFNNRKVGQSFILTEGSKIVACGVIESIILSENSKEL